MGNRGGARPGAGRPKGTVKEARKIYKVLSISGAPEEIDKIKDLASESDKSISRFVIEKVLKDK